VRNLPHGFDVYLANVKAMRKIAEFFVALTKKTEFTKCNSSNEYSLITTASRRFVETCNCGSGTFGFFKAH